MQRGRRVSLPSTILAAALSMFVHGHAQAHAQTWTTHDRGVPILMYHLVSNPPPGAPYPDLYVRPTDFRAQIGWLAAHGYHVVTLQRVYDDWTRGDRLPVRPVVASFDDGYLSQYTRAFPLLEAHRWPGVLNMEVSFLRPVGGLRPWRIRRLLRAGWELDAHTLTHPDLTTLDPPELRRQVAGSRTALRRRFHVPVNFFCYPADRYDAQVVAEVRRAGFLGATTTTYGLARPPRFFTLDRIRIDRSDGLAGFVQKLTASR
jgi:peptidoglycan/xylan/chitin deacetylase (PgdA/CDA1 family)